MHPDAVRWNDRYRREDGPRQSGVESRLEAVEGLLNGQGEALEIAGGAGASALWLAERGYRVCCTDVSVEGLRIAKRASAERCVPLSAVVADSGALPFVPAGRLALVVVIRYLDRRLFPWIRQALAPGGQVFCCTFNRGHLREHPRFNPDFVLAPGELQSVFGAFERQAGADESGSSWILARRPG